MTAPAFMPPYSFCFSPPARPTRCWLSPAVPPASGDRCTSSRQRPPVICLTIVPLATFAGPYLAAHPTAASAIKLCSAVWVLLLAARLWTNSPAGIGAPLVTFRQVFVTTVLNPKALIFGLVLLPHGSLQAMLPWLGMFLMIVLTVACLWLSSGATLIRRANGEFPPLLRRIAASLLLCFRPGWQGVHWADLSSERGAPLHLRARRQFIIKRWRFRLRPVRPGRSSSPTRCNSWRLPWRRRSPSGPSSRHWTP